MDMHSKGITNLSKEEEQKLFNMYFGNLIHEAATVRPETICEYTKELPLKIKVSTGYSLNDCGRSMLLTD